MGKEAPEEPRPVKFFIRTFGCQMNESDSERIAGICRANGAVEVESPEEAELIIVNTCAVRAKAEEKLYSYLGRLARLKAEKPLTIGLVGCVAQLGGARLLEEKPFLDFILGPDTYTELPRLIRSAGAEKFVCTSRSEKWQETPPELVWRTSRVSAYLPVMEGCNNFCAYCVVPFARGREKSRPLRSILNEVRRLAEKGFLEIQLLGQNVNGYKDPETKADFSSLLEAVALIPGIGWLRFITSHPRHFVPRIAETMARQRTICRQLHLPLQSGSTSVLARMNRGYDREEYLEKIALLRRLMPEICLSTDVIVGFPGETEKEFEETLNVLKQVRFTNLYSFRYSPRPFTRAAGLPDDIPPEEKRRRLEEVQRLQREIQAEIHRSFLGRVVRVLCAGRGQKTPHLLTGRSEGNQIVHFSGSEDLIGRFIDVRITGYGPYSLRGKVDDRD